MVLSDTSTFMRQIRSVLQRPFVLSVELGAYDELKLYLQWEHNGRPVSFSQVYPALSIEETTSEEVLTDAFISRLKDHLPVELYAV